MADKDKDMTDVIIIYIVLYIMQNKEKKNLINDSTKKRNDFGKEKSIV
jgi:hypothetical protein